MLVVLPIAPLLIGSFVRWPAILKDGGGWRFMAQLLTEWSVLGLLALIYQLTTSHIPVWLLPVSIYLTSMQVAMSVFWLQSDNNPTKSFVATSLDHRPHRESRWTELGTMLSTLLLFFAVYIVDVLCECGMEGVELQTGSKSFWLKITSFLYSSYLMWVIVFAWPWVDVGGTLTYVFSYMPVVYVTGVWMVLAAYVLREGVLLHRRRYRRFFRQPDDSSPLPVSPMAGQSAKLSDYEDVDVTACFGFCMRHFRSFGGWGFAAPKQPPPMPARRDFLTFLASTVDRLCWFFPRMTFLFAALIYTAPLQFMFDSAVLTGMMWASVASIAVNVLAYVSVTSIAQLAYEQFWVVFWLCQLVIFRSFSAGYGGYLLSGELGSVSGYLTMGVVSVVLMLVNAAWTCGAIAKKAHDMEQLNESPVNLARHASDQRLNR